MKYLDEYRDREWRRSWSRNQRAVTQAVGHHGGLRRADAPIVKYGIDYLLPKRVELVHGPGCPVA